MSSVKPTAVIHIPTLLMAMSAGFTAGACAAATLWSGGYPAALSWVLVAGSAVVTCVVVLAAQTRSRATRRPPLPSPEFAPPRGPAISPSSSAEHMRAELERLVRARIDCADVEWHPRGSEGRLASSAQVSGAHLIAPVDPGAGHEIAVPVAYEGTVLGELVVQRERRAIAFSSQDVNALRDVANNSGFIVAHAIAYGELEQRRRCQAAAFRDEREALVEALSAEIAHEVRYPINFFRSIFQRATADRVLEREDLDIGFEEVERLERLVSGLRRMAIHVDRRVADVAELASRAEVLLRDRMTNQRFTLELRGRAALSCDVDKITQVLVNLLANALDATEERGEVGIDWRLTAHGGELLVWDTGGGFSGDASRLFAPWYTTKPRGTGLGLAIAYRMVRAHGWMLDGLRRDGRTTFVISIPVSDVVLAPARTRESGQELARPVVAIASRREGAA